MHTMDAGMSYNVFDFRGTLGAPEHHARLFELSLQVVIMPRYSQLIFVALSLSNDCVDAAMYGAIAASHRRQNNHHHVPKKRSHRDSTRDTFSLTGSDESKSDVEPESIQPQDWLDSFHALSAAMPGSIEQEMLSSLISPSEKTDESNMRLGVLIDERAQDVGVQKVFKAIFQQRIKDVDLSEDARITLCAIGADGSKFARAYFLKWVLGRPSRDEANDVLQAIGVKSVFGGDWLTPDEHRYLRRSTLKATYDSIGSARMKTGSTASDRLKLVLKTTLKNLRRNHKL